MPVYLIRRLAYALPIMLGVSFLCFMLVHISPGDPLVCPSCRPTHRPSCSSR